MSSAPWLEMRNRLDKVCVLDILYPVGCSAESIGVHVCVLDIPGGGGLTCEVGTQPS